MTDSVPQSPAACEPPLFAFFDGTTYEPRLDRERLTTQLLAVRGLMADGAWRTLREIADAVSIPEASASSRLRDLRKQRFGAYRVERRRRGAERRGLHEYRVTHE